MSHDDVEAFVAAVTPAKRRRDARTLLDLMGRVTGQPPVLHGSIIGFGEYHYHYESGRKGSGPAAAFAPRKAATSVYLPDGIDTYADEIGRIGPHSSGVGCLYLKDLEQNDLDVLERVVAASYARVTAATFTNRARDGAPG